MQFMKNQNRRIIMASANNINQEQLETVVDRAPYNSKAAVDQAARFESHLALAVANTIEKNSGINILCRSITGFIRGNTTKMPGKTWHF